MMGGAADDRPHKPPSKGFALLLVLWGVAILDIVIASMMMSAAASQTAAYSGLAEMRRTTLEDAAVNLTVAALLDKSPDRRLPVDGTSKSVMFDGHAFDISVQDEAGKVDLNTAPIDTITALLMGADLNSGDAHDLAQNIVDWRSRTKKDTRTGVPMDYAANGYPYNARHAALQSTEEVTLVKGMTKATFQRILPGITVYSGQKAIDPDIAPLEALLALPGIDRQKALDIIDARKRGIPFQKIPAAAPSAAASQAPPTAAPQATAPATAPAASGEAYTITTRLPLSPHTEYRRREVVRLTGTADRPFVVLRLEESAVQK